MSGICSYLDFLSFFLFGYFLSATSLLLHAAVLRRCYNRCTYFFFLLSTLISSTSFNLLFSFGFVFCCSTLALTLLPLQTDSHLFHVPFSRRQPLLHLRPPHANDPRTCLRRARPHYRRRPPPSMRPHQQQIRARETDGQKSVWVGLWISVWEREAFARDVDLGAGREQESWARGGDGG